MLQNEKILLVELFARRSIFDSSFLQVESRQALSNFESIAEEADAILLSRGNLGLDVPSEKVAIVQKAAITRCNLLGKPVIITRVVDTMTAAPRCTR